MKPLLSVLIPITPDREDAVQPLFKVLKLIDNTNIWQFSHKENGLMISRYNNPLYPVEVVLAIDNKEMTLGEKRELLYKYADGLYSWQIDSDDLISEDAIELILKAIEQEPDAVSFKEAVYMDGVRKTSNHSMKYERWQDNFDGYDYVRNIFYKDVIKTSIAKSVPFKKIRWNEDEQFAMDLAPLISSEVHIEKELYIYQYSSTPFNERYGIKDN